MLGQEAVADKTNETSAIPVLLERLAAKDGLKGALVSIDAIATNPTIATTIRDAQADYLLAVKANQPTLRAEIETFFADADPADLDSATDLDKGHGRIEQRTVTVAREVDWLDGERRFPGEVRLPDVATIVRVASRTELQDRGRFETRYYVSSASALGRPRRRGRARPLGHREQPALGARRHLRRRSIPPANRARRKKHGRRQTLRHQSRTHRQGQAKHQAQEKTRRMGPAIPRLDPRTLTPLTRISVPCARSGWSRSTAPAYRPAQHRSARFLYGPRFPRLGVRASTSATISSIDH